MRLGRYEGCHGSPGILKTISGTGQLSEMYSIDFNGDICIMIIPVAEMLIFLTFASGIPSQSSGKWKNDPGGSISF